jgi:hypothetical protein
MRFLDASAILAPMPVIPAYADRARRRGLCAGCGWEDDGTVEGEVSQELFWVDTLAPIPTEAQKHAVSASERELIQLYYTMGGKECIFCTRFHP